MTNSHNNPSKAEVQTTKLNRLPVPGEEDTEFSAEEAAEAFEQNASSVQEEQQ
ncbi:hypothetical protein [Cohnella thailandensis]|uniref:Uncharacterized protein n=1 Tax=Cohnella thailandensis TaxID=557557 RepID=A0A841SQU2_9BACL|nr:hypothetical protein [Cohnella thailandensis]MBB6633259.1 hypothetical protein [Cohnella thailandensis]MBP1975043.1 hypothetical protein [Cohnella thailandensis]